MKKYFEFSGTISGTNLLLRNLLSSVIAVVCLSLTNTSSFLGILALLIILPTIWFSVATAYKRISALYPSKVNEYTLGLILLQILNSSLKGSNLHYLTSILLFIFTCVLIFKDSNIQNHNG